MRTRLHYTIDTTENAIVIDGMLLSVEDIRLIVNETQSKVLCSSMKKNLITITQTDNSTHIAVATSVCTFALTDAITIEVDTCVPLATEQAATDNKNAILAAIGGSSGEIGLKPMMEIIMQGFNFAEELAEMVEMTDTEILNTYQAQDTGIADTTYGHLVPADVTIDDIPLTLYQERTYADYGYSVLYREGEEIDTTTTHPAENDVLTTAVVESGEFRV